MSITVRLLAALWVVLAIGVAGPVEAAKPKPVRGGGGQSKGGFSCSNAPQYCKQVKSCAEARFYLRQCGKSDYDRDRDGVPCEGICPGG